MSKFRFYKILIPALLLASPAVALAQQTPKTFGQLVQLIISLINPLIAVLSSLALLIFFYGIVTYIYSAGEEGHAKGRDLIVWGLVALFILVTLWSVANILVSTFLPK